MGGPEVVVGEGGGGGEVEHLSCGEVLVGAFWAGWVFVCACAGEF